MNKVRFGHNTYCYKYLLICCSIIIFSGISTQASEQSAASISPLQSALDNDIIVTQIPSGSNPRAGTALERRKSGAGLFLEFGSGARLVKVNPDSSVEELSRDFHSACDPSVSFDATHILFAGKKAPDDDWNIYEMEIDGSNVRQITNGIGNCRNPDYQAMLYTIVSPEPWYQLTFVGMKKGADINTNLYSCKLDGSAVRRLTFNLSNNMDPFIMYDGRLLFASRHRSALDSELAGRTSLFGINIDGADYALFHAGKGGQIKRMPCTTTKGLVVYIEADELRWDGAGSIGSALLRRPLHSYHQITTESDGLFHSPSALTDGRILVSRRSLDDSDTHGVYRLDPSNRKLEKIFNSPDYHDIQAKIVSPRPEPDGRSSVVTEKDPNGKLYCIDVNISDLAKPEWLPRGTAKRLRVVEGFRKEDEPVIQRRILGEIDIEKDGSFNIEIPASTPIELQMLDTDGIALRSCGWIWAKNHEPRGCIGCHEDGELTPENVLVDAVMKPSVKLNLPIEQRRTVDFQRDIMPIISKKCVQCHSKADSTLRLTEEKASFNRNYKNLLAAGGRPGQGKYIHRGRARTSPLIWHIYGKNTSRPWDEAFSKQKVPQMPPNHDETLTPDEKRTFAEWIDMGALWDSIPDSDNLRGAN
ncbi:MAG: HzsA-related protein [Planctomycetota bacterium]